MGRTIFVIIVCLVFSAAVIVGIYYLVKRLIKYNSELKSRKTKRQIELEKMNIDDL